MLLVRAISAAWLAFGLPAASAQGEPAVRPATATGAASPASAPGRARNEAGKQAPVILQADEIRGRPDLETIATGDVELKRGPVSINADELSYENAEDLAKARGHVRIENGGNRYTGRELQLRVQRFEGFFLEPTFFFERTGGGGRADRIDFIDQDRLQAVRATYTSCPADSSGGPDWLLEASRVKLDLEANEGVAEGAVLRFLGVPILGAPVLSFPLTDARKSGWLPPSVNLDSKSGLEVVVPYYWNIAPQRDATFAPGILSRRGVSLDSEFRYLEPGYGGIANLHLVPHDRVTGTRRNALRLRHEGDLPLESFGYLRVTRASDDAYWKDFPRALDSVTPRLLVGDGLVSRQWQPSFGDVRGYARVQRWQVLRDPDPAALIVAPYQRSPQVGVDVSAPLAQGFELQAQTEFNRFTLPSGETDATRPTGDRFHLLGSISRPWVTPGAWVTPKLTLNSARYRIESTPIADSRTVSRTIPTFSVDGGLVFERNTQWFGRPSRQTLEPRVVYVNTPYRDQSGIPLFDAAARDFNFESIYTDNAFTGIDRVSDAHQVAAGVTTRLLDPATGAETMRLGIVQRYLLRDQQITPEGIPLTQRFSDVLLLGSTDLVPRWHFDASVQYNPDLNRVSRSVLGVRYSPGPFRTLSTRYRLTRDLTEQFEFAWQWPLYGREPPAERLDRSQSALARSLNSANGGQNCGGTWYTVGRVNWSTRDKRIVDSLVGFEYDAGCWIGRVVAERLSTGRSEATTRLLFQLELVGLSRLGSNPLATLRDNIPGYRLLRDERRDPYGFTSP